jgi:hypothetical protein
MEPRTLRGQRLWKTVALPDWATWQVSKNMMAVLGAIRDWPMSKVTTGHAHR